MEHVGTDEMPADLLMKALHRVKVGKFGEMMGLKDGGSVWSGGSVGDSATT